MFCYCCSGKTFESCCAPYLQQNVTAPTCEALMRSRYSAYCLKNVPYLLATLAPDQQQIGLAAEISQFANSVHFCKLAINATQTQENTGIVDFAAYFISGQTLEVLAEVSDFIYTDRWYYHSGAVTTFSAGKLSRNDPCPCGSGKKFKQCQIHQVSGQKVHS